MATVTSPTSLQWMCEATASSWLVEWSGVVGQVALWVASSKAKDISGKQLNPFSHLSDTSDIFTPKQVSGKGKGRLPEEVKCDITQHAVPGQLFQEGKSQEIKLLCKYGGLAKSNSRKAHFKSDIKTCSHLYGQVSDRVLTPQEICYESVNTIVEKNVPLSAEKSSGQGMRNTLSLKHTIPSNDIPHKLDYSILKKNMKQCSAYLKSYLPPLLIDGVINSAWRNLSEQVVVGNCEECVPKYQVVDWAKRAPVVLLIAADLSERKFSLNISGIADDILEDALSFIFKYFPQGQVNKVFLRKNKFKSNSQSTTKCYDIFKRLLEKTSLVSLTLDSNICDNSILSILSQLPLQELDIGGSAANEEGVIKELGRLPVHTANEVVNAVHSGEFWATTLSPLRKSLCKLSVSFYNIPNLVYQVIPIIFPHLQYYNPRINIVQCVQNYVRVTRPPEGSNPLLVPPNTLQLVRINMGHASKNQILEVGRVCPALKEMSLSIELNCEETLAAVQTHKHLTGLELIYYPSFASSPPKLNGKVLLPLVMNFRQQLECLSLTGFNITGSVLYELSQLPDLRTLKLSDSWISNPNTFPRQSFPSLENLTLQFLPPECIMQLFTASHNLVNLSFEFIASDWEGNALTDAHIKYLVTSGMISSIQSFSASSPFLTVTSLNSLALLPSLRSVGFVAHWGLTEEELRCISHSGPPHILCVH
ncbi:uncharacterized protein [Panulirus ornatus]|uniref:uncharacterized protein n=1 Tax=Panulirus ornatus TaxID=150431 RepID=UPI003A876266